MKHAVRWTSEKIAQRLALIEPLVYRRRADLPPFHYHTLPDPAAPPPVSPETAITAWPTLPPDRHWGAPDTNFVLHTDFVVPSDWDATQPIALWLPLGDADNFSHPEALAYIDGVAYATSDRHHQEIRLRPEWCDGKPRRLALHGWTGMGRDWNSDPTTVLVMRQCAVVQIDQPTRDFIALARVALNTAQHLGEHDPSRHRLFNALNAAFNHLDTREPFGAGFYASVAAAHEALQAGVATAGPPLGVRLTATGHAHIDVAWLWTLDQTRRKAGRTFHNVLRLMEQFPDYHFTQSQPQLYEYIRHDYPELFAAIAQRIAEGRWEPIGGMWIEADCNLSGAEALARQFLLGRNYFRQHFGAEAESPVLWLPDVFGYAWALPQLIKLAGLDYFFTIKLGWNQYNRIPYDSFWWQGIDGTRVLTHFGTTTENDTTPASTYNAPARAEDALRAWKHFQQKAEQSEVFMAFGYGDGGGGPTREMLENLAILGEFPAMPQVQQRSAKAFFRDLERDSGAELPTWDGELYLEYHRGTYTTQARNKRANRKSEFLLHDCEFLASLAATIDPTYRYPQAELNAAWQLLCLNQFHDIIPGSSIGPVYRDSLQQYAELSANVNALREQALATISTAIGGDVVVANPTSFTRRDLVWYSGAIPAGKRLIRSDGGKVGMQMGAGGAWLAVGPLAPYSVTALHWADEAPPQIASSSMAISPEMLENAYVRVELNRDGDIVRIYDKMQQREVLARGGLANQFQLFEDRPKFWDAWDIDSYFDDRMWLAEPAEAIRVVEEGTLRVCLEITRRIGNSRYVQRLSLEQHSARLNIHTQIDWRERHMLLKVAFPLRILAPVATYDIQWGNVQRPTHRNTSWDWARFETCAHKWADLSEGGYGVSLLNDCKYGYDINGNLLRLSLLRSPTIPDPEADQGSHEFTYSLYPHADSVGYETQREAYELNNPLIAASGSGATNSGAPPLVQCNVGHVVIETVKRAEDGNGLIVRLYEAQRRRGPISVTTAFQIGRAELVNLLEEPLDLADYPETAEYWAIDGQHVHLGIAPYQIISLRLMPLEDAS